MSANTYRMLFAYNAWANEKILARAAEVPEADYFADAPGFSFGSLHVTLVHSFVADVIWLSRWRGVLPPEALSDPRRSDLIGANEVTSFEQLAALWGELEALRSEWLAGLTDEAVDSVLTYRNSAGNEFTEPLEELMLHDVNHGTQFRSEAAVRLTQLGYSPGDLDLIVYLRERLQG